MSRTLVVGLDSVPARLVLEAWPDSLPTLRQLAEAGVASTLRSTDPPITVPAWASMMTGVDPGALGLYGFHDRADRSYERRSLATSSRVRHATVWERAAARGLRSIVIGVPPSYPPKPCEGVMQVCDFLAPGTDVDYTSPSSLAREIAAELGEYGLDVPDYRAEDKLRILRECHRITEQRFTLARHWMRSRPWDLFVMVEIAPDRLQHALFSQIDPSHPRHVVGSRLGELARRYYETVDRRLGELVELAGEGTHVLVVSDHGARPLKGGVRLNEWLRRQGLLVLRHEPAAGEPFQPQAVDWTRTLAWADGGYVGRVYLNGRGREPQGTVSPAEMDRVGREIADGLREIEGADGARLETRVLRPGERYAACRGIPPDLWVYFGDLDWRALGSFGPGPLSTRDNDTGPDEANHDFDGLFLMRGPDGHGPRSAPADLDLLDVAPTLLDALGVPVEGALPGRSLLGAAEAS